MSVEAGMGCNYNVQAAHQGIANLHFTTPKTCKVRSSDCVTIVHDSLLPCLGFRYQAATPVLKACHMEPSKWCKGVDSRVAPVHLTA
jgi:hypothetical protein